MVSGRPSQNESHAPASGTTPQPPAQDETAGSNSDDSPAEVIERDHADQQECEHHEGWRHTRLIEARIDDFWLLSGMNRIRHAYLEIAPGLEPYFVTGHHDDEQGLDETYGPGTGSRSYRLIGETSTLVAVISAALAGVFVGLVANAASTGSELSLVIGAVVTTVLVVALVSMSRRLIERGRRLLEPRFARQVETVRRHG